MSVWVGLKQWVKGEIGDREEWQALGLPGSGVLYREVHRKPLKRSSREADRVPVAA